MRLVKMACQMRLQNPHARILFLEEYEKHLWEFDLSILLNMPPTNQQYSYFPFFPYNALVLSCSHFSLIPNI